MCAVVCLALGPCWHVACWWAHLLHFWFLFPTLPPPLLPSVLLPSLIALLSKCNLVSWQCGERAVGLWLCLRFVSFLHFSSQSLQQSRDSYLCLPSPTFSVHISLVLHAKQPELFADSQFNSSTFIGMITNTTSQTVYIVNHNEELSCLVRHKYQTHQFTTNLIKITQRCWEKS